MKPDAIAVLRMCRRIASNIAVVGSISLCGLNFGGSSAFATESQSYALYWLSHAAYSTNDDCGAGKNLDPVQQYEQTLTTLGYPSEQAKEIVKKDAERGGGGWDKDVLGNIVVNRAVINGKHINAYAHPEAVVDVKLKSQTGKFAYGFNLDGEGATKPTSYIDPETKEVGVEHNLMRVLGCTEAMRGTLQNSPAFWVFMWKGMRDTTPAWILTVTGGDLKKDGPVTISFGRAMEAVKMNGNGSPRADMTFRLDPNPALNHNVYKGEIRGGVITVLEHESLHLTQDPLTFPNFDLKQMHARFTPRADGTLLGVVGGYQPIIEPYFAISNAGYDAENSYTAEIPGLYHSMKRFADADPDASGQNMSISASYHLEMVPAFVIVSEKSEPLTSNIGPKGVGLLPEGTIVKR